MRGRKEGRVGAGGSGAEASCPKGFRIPGGAAALGLFPLGRDPAEMEQWRSMPAAPVRMPQVGPAEASCPPQDLGQQLPPRLILRWVSSLGQDQWSGSGA